MRLKLLLASASASLALSACASNVAQVETLSRYDRLTEAERGLVPVREYADSAAMAGVISLYLQRATIATGVVEASGVDAERLDRVAGVLSRTMCRRLARGGEGPGLRFGVRA